MKEQEAYAVLIRKDPDWLAVDYEPTLAERKLAAAKLRAMLEEELWRIEASKHEKMAAWSLLKRL